MLIQSIVVNCNNGKQSEEATVLLFEGGLAVYGSMDAKLTVNNLTSFLVEVEPTTALNAPKRCSMSEISEFTRRLPPLAHHSINTIIVS